MSTFSTCVLDLPDGPRNPLYGNMPLGFTISPIEEATRSASEMKREGWDGSLSSSNFQLSFVRISGHLAPLCKPLAGLTKHLFVCDRPGDTCYGYAKN